MGPTVTAYSTVSSNVHGNGAMFHSTVRPTGTLSTLTPGTLSPMGTFSNQPMNYQKYVTSTPAPYYPVQSSIAPATNAVKVNL